VFGREKTPPPPLEDVTPTPRKVGGKGHATPRRKEAQAANRRPLVPTDRKAASKDARAAQRRKRDLEYQAMMTGDEQNMPLQHRGPVRRYVRDAVDSQRTSAEYFLPAALVLLVGAVAISGLLGSAAGTMISTTLVLLPYFYLAFSALDTFLRWRRLKAVLTRKFGAAGTARGTAGYFVMRAYQLRRLRMPKPQVRPGQLPR